MSPEEISALAAVINCVAFLASLGFIYHQLDQMKKSTMATAFAKAVEILQDEERRKDRGFIFSLGETKTPYEQWTSDHV